MKIRKLLQVLGLACVGVLAVVSAQGASIAANVQRMKVEGIDVIVYPTAVKDVVTIVGSLPGGDAFAGEGNVAVPSLVGMMLDRGTTKQDKYAIAQKLESIGAAIGFSVEEQAVGIHGRTLKENLPLVMGLLAEQLRMPAFKADEFDKARKQFIGGVKSRLEDVNFRAQDAFDRRVFPAGHPNRQPSIDEYANAAEGATLEQVKAFHQKYYGPAHMTLVLVGDVDAQQIKAELTKAFAGWKGGVDYLQAQRAAPATAARTEVVRLEQKPSVSILIGQATGLRYKDPDALALRVGTAILGSGFTGRLMATVRDQEGLTYGIGAKVAADTFVDGTWAINATFAPQLLDQGLSSTRRELMKWWKDGVTAQELEARKTNLIGAYQVSLATSGGMASALLAAVQRGYDLTWLDQYPKAVDSLTREQVNAAIRKYLDPEKMLLVKAGTVSAAQN